MIESRIPQEIVSCCTAKVSGISDIFGEKDLRSCSGSPLSHTNKVSGSVMLPYEQFKHATELRHIQVRFFIAKYGSAKYSSAKYGSAQYGSASTDFSKVNCFVVQ